MPQRTMPTMPYGPWPVVIHHGNSRASRGDAERVPTVWRSSVPSLAADAGDGGVGGIMCDVLAWQRSGRRPAGRIRVLSPSWPGRPGEP
jgi:hypothetical protein